MVLDVDGEDHVYSVDMRMLKMRRLYLETGRASFRLPHYGLVAPGHHHRQRPPESNHLDRLEDGCAAILNGGTDSQNRKRSNPSIISLNCWMPRHGLQNRRREGDSRLDALRNLRRGVARRWPT